MSVGFSYLKFRNADGTFTKEYYSEAPERIEYVKTGKAKYFQVALLEDRFTEIFLHRGTWAGASEAYSARSANILPRQFSEDAALDAQGE
jgi:hypothetical protein